MNRSAQFYQVTFGGVSNVLSKKKEKGTEDWREGGGAGRKIFHYEASTTFFYPFFWPLVLQGTKLLRGTTVLLSEYFRALKMLQSVKVWKLFYRKVEDWSIPSHFLSSLGSQLRRY